jgi:hypothetical protein
MSNDKWKIFWSVEETSTHQDHVIAHVIGASVLGYFVLDESLHIVLDIGFIWTIYLDGQMVLLPQTAAVSELEVEATVRSELSREIEQLERDGRGVEGLQHVTAAPVDCVIAEVSFFASEDKRRLVLQGETASLNIETSLRIGTIEVRAED